MSPNKDLVETALIYKPDVAAGVVNAFYANGSTLVKPEFLRDARLASSYESNDALRKLNRDVAKFCVRDGKCEWEPLKTPLARGSKSGIMYSCLTKRISTVELASV